MNIRKVTAALIATLILATGTAWATIVNVGPDDRVSVDGVSYDLVTTAPDHSGLMWEKTDSGTYKTCACMMFSFRALQALGQYLKLDNLNKATITIVSGWNTNGPKHIFVDSMGWKMGADFSYPDPVAASPDLTLHDAWLTFTLNGTTYKISSQAQNYAFIDNKDHPGYHAGWDFFNYRTYFKKTSGMDNTKKYFRDVICDQVITNFINGAAFDVTPIP